MAWPVKTLTQRIDEIEKAYASYISPDELPLSVQKARSRVLAYQINALEEYIKYMSKQMVPTTAEKEYLEYHCAAKGIYRKQAVAAFGTLKINGSEGIIIEAGAIINRNIDNISYKVTETITLSDGEQLIKVECLTPGATGNCSEGELFTFANAVAGVDTQATADLIGAGADVETDKDLLYRYLQVIRNVFHGGNDNDYIKWALQVEGVNRAWCYPCALGPGTVIVRIMTPTGFPDELLCQKVVAHINSVRPPTYSRFLVMSPTGKVINIELMIKPDTDEARNNIEAAFRSLLDDSSEPEGEVLVSAIHAAILSVSGLDDYTLFQPQTNIKCGLGELAVLGEVTWHSPSNT